MDQELQSTFAAQKAVYDVLWGHFYGTHWDETVKQKRGKTEPARLKWPLRINYVQPACLIHTAVWAGDMPDTSEPVAKPHLEPSGTGKLAARAAEHATDKINQVWYENSGRAKLMAANTVAQAVGGVVFRLRMDTDLGWRRTLPIRIDTILPDNFVCIPDVSDPYDLLEAWHIVEMPLRMAERQYGYVGKKRDADTVQMVEHWTRDEFKITIGDKVATFRDVKMEGDNKLGFVPFVYMPHVRHAGAFEGIPLFAQILSLLEEYNGRMANEGDLFIKAIHSMPWIRNISAKLSVANIGGQRFIDLGKGRAGTGGEPAMGQQEQPNVGGSLTNYNERLDNKIKELSFTPEIIWGSDSGSQRSGESRDRLLLPLTIHINHEREFSTQAFNALDEMILRMLAANNLAGINDRHLNHRMAQIWHPMYPADRAKLIEEVERRLLVNSLSLEKALEMYGDVEDIDAEIALIEAWAKKKAAAIPQPVEKKNNEEPAE